MSAAKQYDVVIIGSGVVGALMSWKLAQAGARVLVLEAGERGKDRADLVETWAAATRKGLGSPYVASEPEKIPGPEQYTGDPKNAPAHLYNAYYDQVPSDNEYQSTYERRVGGTTWHWLGHTPRLLPNDFRMKSVYGVAVDWPIRYDDIEPWYCEAEKELGVSGDDEQWQNVHGGYRSQPFPMPKIWTSWSDDFVTRAVESVQVDGNPLRVFATPAARNSLPYQGRPPCAGNASCIPICPIGAKYDASVHIRMAEAAQATIQDKSVVTRLHVDPDGAVRRVSYRRWDGTEETVAGRVVIVAANAIETPKLLLMSAGDHAPNGVANSSGIVGQNLMDHLQKSVLARVSERVFPFRGPPSTAGIETLRDGRFRSAHSALRFSLNNDGWARRGSPFSDVEQLVSQGFFGAVLQEKLRDRVQRQIRISLSTEVLPAAENAVTLSEKLDSFGLPRPKISFHPAEYTRGAFPKGLDVIGAILKALNATDVEYDGDINKFNGAGHIMGTTRMGHDAKSAVVDADCRSFDHHNLFIVGGGAFPTCGTPNPTLTIAALALRAAAHIEKTLHSFTPFPDPKVS